MISQEIISDKQRFNTQSFISSWGIIFAFVLIKLFIHFATNINYGLHRDEFLYAALGQHLDFGFASTPPSIAFFAHVVQSIFGESVFGMRFFPALIGGLLIFLTGLSVKEMNGGKFAQFIACLAVLLSPAYLRSQTLFQPVSFDQLYFVLCMFFTIRFIKTESSIYLYFFSLALGFGLLNKYSIILVGIGFVFALLISNHRHIFLKKEPYLAAGLAFLIFLPNFLWQIFQGFPVLSHMAELQKTQLLNVTVSGFLVDQILMNISGFYLWLLGLWFVFFTESGKKFIVVGWIFFFVFFALLLAHGKSYYTLGIFPVMMAAGSVYLEQLTSIRKWVRIIPTAFTILILIPILPISLPVLPKTEMANYCDSRKDRSYFQPTIRWEDGQLHQIPQDYADMLGWEELAHIVAATYQNLPDSIKTQTAIVAANYGQAGAIDFYGKAHSLPEVISFSDAYLYWTPEILNAKYLIYIDDETEDVSKIFREVIKVGEITEPLAREYGLSVYVCKNPRFDYSDLWKQLRKNKFEK